jgi:sugar phosphate isomerase/epimerase
MIRAARRGGAGPGLLAFGYNTNGFAHHALLDAIDVIAGLGYAGLGLTLDVHHLNPLTAAPAEVARVEARLRARGLRVVVETGARYVLDPWRKHEPTLLGEGCARRAEFLEAAIRVARDLGAEAVALFSGRRPEGVAAEDALERLLAGLEPLLARGVPLAFEPEPGMLVDDLAGYDRLAARLPGLLLTLDIGHVRCTERCSIEDAIARYAPRIANVHVEDIRGRTHEHLDFGEGEIDFPPVLAALERAGYRGLVQVELSRHSHDAPAAARRAIAFLGEALARARD